MNNNFKVGDKIRVKKETRFGRIPAGHILTVDDVEYSNNWTFSTKQDDSVYETRWYWQPEDDDCFELVQEYEQCKTEYNGNEKINSNNVNKTIMSKITTFAKNLVLSNEEKLLRKYGLKNECGEFTSEATELVITKLVKENETYLIDLSKKMEEEENKK